MAQTKTLKTVNKTKPLSVSSVGNLSFNFLTGVSSVKQTVKTRIDSFKTEFYYNKKYGVDWYGVVLNNASQQIEKEAALNDAVSGTTGVTSVLSSSLILDKAAQKQYYVASIVSNGEVTDVVAALTGES
jgi:hypothetical protein